MNGRMRFKCHDFFDNTNLCILEISIGEQTHERQFEWLLIDKTNLSVKKMKLKTQDASNFVQERFFDLGFLKYDGNSGVFIEAAAKDLHHLEQKGCENIPQAYLLAVEEYLKSYITHSF